MTEINTNTILLPDSWKAQLSQEFKQAYMIELKNFLRSEILAGKKIFPKPKEYFNAFYMTLFDQVKVVILGQDPYHGYGQAHGLCFSVPASTPLPPSLQNIFLELKQDIAVPTPTSGSLTHWAKQGVLLLNATLTVESGKAGSHQNKGWEIFTDKVIHVLNQQKEHLVFMLWGSYAQKKGAFIDTSRHLVLTATHPSPLSAHKGFFGCKHFSKANQYLKAQKKAEINWNNS